MTSLNLIVNTIMAENKEQTVQSDWLLDTLMDAEQSLATAIALIKENPRKARGVLEHEVAETYAKLNYAVNTAYIGPNAINEMDHDALIAWPEAMPFGKN